MSKRSLIITIGALVALAVPPLAAAQATRTWVSGVGDDANPCSRTAPCKTFAGAISKTATGGIINVLDPGGYGAVTITKPITIMGPPGMAEILSSGVQGIIINITSGSPKPVILRNLDISGTGTTYGTNGISFLNGRTLRLQNVNIDSYSTAGLNVSAPNSKVYSNNLNITDTSQGIRISPSSGTTTATLKHTDIIGGSYGLLAYGASTNVSMTDCAVTDESVVGVYLSASHMQLNDCDIHDTGIGINAEYSALARVVNSTITNNTNGVYTTTGGSVLSRGNNTLEDNASGNTFTGTYGPK